MEDYWTARNNRYLDISKKLDSLAKKLIEKGFKVFTLGSNSSYKYLTWLGVEKDGNHVSVSFQDVPYRWTYGIDIDKKLGHGSGRTVHEDFDYNYTPTVDDVESRMRPIVNGYEKSSHIQEFRTWNP